MIHGRDCTGARNTVAAGDGGHAWIWRTILPSPLAPGFTNGAHTPSIGFTILFRPRTVLMPNRLAHESSPYLLQHQNNPVDWYPWGPEALERSRQEQKPIFLSIGYSACHWCHVMEHESFENAEI